MAIAVGEERGWTVVTVSGALDVYTAPSLRERFADLITAGHCRLITEMEQVTFVDATGLGVLVGALHRSTAFGGDLRVVATAELVLHAMRVTGVLELFAPYDSVGEALTVSPALATPCGVSS